MPEIRCTDYGLRAGRIRTPGPVLETLGCQHPVFLTARKARRVCAPGIHRDAGRRCLQCVGRRSPAILALGRDTHGAANRLGQVAEAKLERRDLPNSTPGRVWRCTGLPELARRQVSQTDYKQDAEYEAEDEAVGQSRRAGTSVALVRMRGNHCPGKYRTLGTIGNKPVTVEMGFAEKAPRPYDEGPPFVWCRSARATTAV